MLNYGLFVVLLLAGKCLSIAQLRLSVSEQPVKREPGVVYVTDKHMVHYTVSLKIYSKAFIMKTTILEKVLTGPVYTCLH